MVWDRDWVTHAEFQLVFLFATLGTCLSFLCLFHGLRKRIKQYGIDYAPRSCPLHLDPRGTGSPLSLISTTVLTLLAVLLMFPFSFHENSASKGGKPEKPPLRRSWAKGSQWAHLCCDHQDFEASLSYTSRGSLWLNTDTQKHFKVLLSDLLPTYNLSNLANPQPRVNLIIRFIYSCS